MLSPDQERIRSILYETITSICKNGLRFDKELRVDALIGVTLDQNEVFLITVNEKIVHDNLPSCQIINRSISDHSKGNIETPTLRQSAEMHGLSQTKSSRIAAKIDRRQNSLSDLECSGVTRNILVEDCAIDESMNGYRNMTEKAVAERTSSARVSFDLVVEHCHDNQDFATVHEPPHSQLDAQDMLSNERLSNASSLKHYDDRDTVTVIKQEHGERDDSLDNSSVGSGPLTCHGYDRNDPCNASLSNANRPHFIRSDPCKILGKQMSLMAASSNSLSIPHHLLERCDPASRLSALSGSNGVGGIRMMCSSQHPPSDRLTDHGESTSQFYQRRRCRSFLSPYQNSRLNRAFAQSQYLTSEMKAQLAEELQLRANVIGIWFQNRRYKLKKKYLSYQRDSSSF